MFHLIFTLRLANSQFHTERTHNSMSGLNSIALAVAHLEDLNNQKQQQTWAGKDQTNSESSAAHTTTAYPRPTAFAAPQAQRVVSSDSIYGDAEDENDSPPCGTQRKSPAPVLHLETEKEHSSASLPVPADQADVTQGTQPSTQDAVETTPAGSHPAPSNSLSLILADPHAWLKATELRALPAAPSGAWDKVLTHDVLCGRGGESNHHPGNQQYRKLVKAFQPLYIASKRRDKPRIAQCIVYTIRSYGGRFLKRLDPRSNHFEDVGNTKAREKTSQALREGAPELRGKDGDSSPVDQQTEAIQRPPSPTAVPQRPSPTAAMPASALPPLMLLQQLQHQQPTYPPSYHHAFHHNPFSAGFTPLQRALLAANNKGQPNVPSSAPASSVQVSSQPAFGSADTLNMANAPTTISAAASVDDTRKRAIHVVSSSEDSSSTTSENSSSSIPRGPRVKRLKQRLQLEPQFEDAED